MPPLDADTIKELSRQGAGVMLALFMFVIWIIDKRAEKRANAAHVTRLEGILRERKSDRDAMLTMLAKLESHLARADAFEAFARETIRDHNAPEHPRRREADRLLAEALARVSKAD